MESIRISQSTIAFCTLQPSWNHQFGTVIFGRILPHKNKSNRGNNLHSDPVVAEIQALWHVVHKVLCLFTLRVPSRKTSPSHRKGTHKKWQYMMIIVSEKVPVTALVWIWRKLLKYFNRYVKSNKTSEKEVVSFQCSSRKDYAYNANARFFSDFNAAH